MRICIVPFNHFFIGIEHLGTFVSRDRLGKIRCSLIILMHLKQIGTDVVKTELRFVFSLLLAHFVFGLWLAKLLSECDSVALKVESLLVNSHLEDGRWLLLSLESRNQHFGCFDLNPTAIFNLFGIWINPHIELIRTIVIFLVQIPRKLLCNQRVIIFKLLKLQSCRNSRIIFWSQNWFVSLLFTRVCRFDLWFVSGQLIFPDDVLPLEDVLVFC